MPNDWFQFKQFKIHQDKCAMKVSTDACIQGAFGARYLQLLQKEAPLALDIGTGTGLLTLMMAQAKPAGHFQAVEINEDAYHQATINFEESLWKEHIESSHQSITAFSEDASNAGQYDFIICNPPFFQNHLESTAKARNDARHSQSLSKEAMAKAVVALLQNDGLFCVMFPTSEWEIWLKTALQSGLYLHASLAVKPNAGKAPNRMVGLFGKQNATSISDDTLIIYLEDKQYSDGMKLLLRDYYLAF